MRQVLVLPELASLQLGTDDYEGNNKQEAERKRLQRRQDKTDKSGGQGVFFEEGA